MCGTEDPSSLNWVMADAADSAASATEIFPEAARSRAPRSPPLRMSDVETPALASSSMPCAASDAENAVSAPAFRAASRSCSISPEDAIVAACTDDIFDSKSAAVLIIPPKAAAPTAPKPRAAVPAVFHARAFFSA